VINDIVSFRNSYHVKLGDKNLVIAGLYASFTTQNAKFSALCKVFAMSKFPRFQKLNLHVIKLITILLRKGIEHLNTVNRQHHVKLEEQILVWILTSYNILWSILVRVLSE